MREAFRFLYRANYLLTLATMSAALAFAVSRITFWLACVAALVVIGLLAALFKLDSPNIVDNASPPILVVGHGALLIGHVLFWPAAIAMKTHTEGNLGYVIFLVGGMMLIPGAAICYVAGLAMVEFCRLRWRGLFK